MSARTPVHDKPAKHRAGSTYLTHCCPVFQIHFTKTHALTLEFVLFPAVLVRSASGMSAHSDVRTSSANTHVPIQRRFK